jgi:uncharacterized protein involved in type VI secretion and phage assembly
MKRIPGVVVGIVKSVDDPRGEARIQLEFRNMPEAQKSNWAPVAVPLAGKNRGMFFMPEIEDEVLVAFENGDFDHPFVVGFLWNGVDTPPETEKKNRVILTPGKHTLRFEDKEGAKKIILKSSSGHEVAMDDTPAGKTISVKTAGGLSIVMDDKDSSIEMRGGGRIIAMRAGAILMT